MNNIVLKVNKEVQDKMIKYYSDKKRNKEIPYVIFQAEENDTVITLYTSGKVLFQGVSADVDAMMWQEMMGITKEELDKQSKINLAYYRSSAVGSDEVGTGDYFGPVVVTACFVKKEDIKYLEDLGVCDSKKTTDEKILRIAPEIMKRIPYRTYILNDKEYNEEYRKNPNLNKIKAMMHNQVLYQLVNEEKPNYDYIIVDEFARENRYYSYLEDAVNVQRNITFLTKAESKNLAVASASVISRYIFLKEFDKLSDELSIPLPKGAGSDVDSIGEEVVEKYGEQKLDEVAKTHFANTQRILHTLIY